ncbi:MAG: hypothetical protein FRX49_04157 [Trebouxia sp. A1-2]|nr:MAG: hypothetical protein FRX49_04157 [Trebouxia sp. A1-2]
MHERCKCRRKGGRAGGGWPVGWVGRRRLNEKLLVQLHVHESPALFLDTLGPDIGEEKKEEGQEEREKKKREEDEEEAKHEAETWLTGPIRNAPAPADALGPTSGMHLYHSSIFGRTGSRPGCTFPAKEIRRGCAESDTRGASWATLPKGKCVVDVFVAVPGNGWRIHAV